MKKSWMWWATLVASTLLTSLNAQAEPPEQAQTPPTGAPALPEVTDPDAPQTESAPPAGEPEPGSFEAWWKNERTGPAKPAPSERWVRGCIACKVPFTGEKYRKRGPAAWFRRTAADWLAMPATVVSWGARDWLTFGGFTAATVVPMLPLNPSLDVRFQNWIDTHKTARSDKAFIHVGTTEIVAGIVLYEALIMGAGWAANNERLLEYGSLSVEVIADVQFYHVMAKLLLGREGPRDNNGQGKVHGPTQVFFPAGTPSGHAATIYALLTVAAEYADSWPLRIFSHLASLYFAASLIYRDAHYLSDSIWGLAMGYYMGRWVMRYRSSRYRCDSPRERSWRERIQWMPVVNHNGAMLGASITLD